MQTGHIKNIKLLNREMHIEMGVWLAGRINSIFFFRFEGIKICLLRELHSISLRKKTLSFKKCMLIFYVDITF